MIETRDWKNFQILNILKEYPCIRQNLFPNYNSRETLEKEDANIWNNENLDERKGLCRITVTLIRYERQSESLKQIDNEIPNLLKSKLMGKLQ